MSSGPRRITLVADEMLGRTRTGGIGTATTFLALALGRMGHTVELLYTGELRGQLDAEWSRLYAGAGVAVRTVPRSGDRVEPGYFARPYDIELVLAADPPDVVIAQDLAAPAYAALRMRQAGLRFEQTLFIVYCHGGRRWITDTARKVRVLPGAHAITVMEQACVELADVIVSPSAYLLDWMRAERWTLPENSLVIPYLTRAVATGEEAPRAASGGKRVERIAFFGRLEERKGLRQFAEGLNALEPELLHGLELEFVGGATPAWPRARIEGLLSSRTKDALAAVSFHTTLDQPAALARLSRAGTLAIMPSLGETFSNAVYECLERGIPFLASDAGAPRELVADEDRDRVLFPPTAGGVADALRRALTGGDALRPAKAAFDPSDSSERWREVVGLRPSVRPAHRVSSPDEWTVLGNPPPDALQTLMQAQAASGADIVTCGITLPSGAHRLFLGDAAGLGVLGNHYGVVAIVRRALVTNNSEPAWPLLARLALEGAEIVSIPAPLVASAEEPADVARNPAEALSVIHEFERHLPPNARYLARLAAGLAVAKGTPGARRRRTVRGALRRLTRR